MDLFQSFRFLFFYSAWMAWNVLLAFIPMLLGHVINKRKSTFASVVLLCLWMLFLPNTLYLVTDVIHIFGYEFNRLIFPVWILGVLLFATIISLGLFTFYHATRPVFTKHRKNLAALNQYQRVLLYSVFSFLVGFAITMGRFQRTNSWYVFTQPTRVISDVITTFKDGDSFLLLVAFSIATYLLIYVFDMGLRGRTKK